MKRTLYLSIAWILHSLYNTSIRPLSNLQQRFKTYFSLYSWNKHENIGQGGARGDGWHTAYQLHIKAFWLKQIDDMTIIYIGDEEYSLWRACMTSWTCRYDENAYQCHISISIGQDLALDRCNVTDKTTDHVEHSWRMKEGCRSCEWGRKVEVKVKSAQPQWHFWSTSWSPNMAMYIFTSPSTSHGSASLNIYI